MKKEQIQLFKPIIKNYGFVFNLDFDPILFIVNSKNKISEGIPIVEDTTVMSDEELDYYLDNDMYMLLDPCETIMVSVDVCDILLNEINVDDITDENFNNYTYSLTVSISMENHRKYFFNLQSVPYGTL